uniref:RING-type domain-containing protein n=1 Tax=Timema genevievae TaxID=629358 RepID=A0A7R9PG51_TIMGE|nr:unnamed protein product [Timema genevievae]
MGFEPGAFGLPRQRYLGIFPCPVHSLLKFEGSVYDGPLAVSCPAGTSWRCPDQLSLAETGSTNYQLLSVCGVGSPFSHPTQVIHYISSHSIRPAGRLAGFSNLETSFRDFGRVTLRQADLPVLHIPIGRASKKMRNATGGTNNLHLNSQPNLKEQTKPVREGMIIPMDPSLAPPLIFGRIERYKKPVISVCCWHVHCEECWLHTLGAKKLCPQCNMITSPSDLRRIYM